MTASHHIPSKAEAAEKPRASTHGGESASASQVRIGQSVTDARLAAGRSVQRGTDPLSSAAIRLLRFESALRRINTHEAWALFVANETRQITQSQQTFVFRGDRAGGMQVVAASALATVDRNAPLVVWMESIVNVFCERAEEAAFNEFDVGSVKVPMGIADPAYPLIFMTWLPMIDLRGQVIGGVLQAKSRPWLEAETILSKHVADACGHALIALASLDAKSGRYRRLNTRHLGYGLGCLCVLSMLPVSMTALAPVEVVAKGAFVVAAPIEGVVDKVTVSPNEAVKRGQILLKFSDTVLSNRFEVAEREALVAEAKLKKAAQLAFVDIRGRHELGIAQAELELRRTERDYARDLLERSVVKAERDGVAIFSDPKDLIGRPVSVGERLMEVADPREVEFRIDLPVSDAVVLREGARVKVFLDSDPLGTIEAKLVRADFQARVRENQTLAFKVTAQIKDVEHGKARLGVRGTAQVYSDRVTLALYLLRRPFSAVRQWLGV